MATNGADLQTAHRLLTPQETARILKVHKGTLARWRMEGRGPKFLKLGEHPLSPVRYRPADIKAFLESAAVESEEQ